MHLRILCGVAALSCFRYRLQSTLQALILYTTLDIITSIAVTYDMAKGKAYLISCYLFKSYYEESVFIVGMSVYHNPDVLCKRVKNFKRTGHRNRFTMIINWSVLVLTPAARHGCFYSAVAWTCCGKSPFSERQFFPICSHNGGTSAKSFFAAFFVILRNAFLCYCADSTGEMGSWKLFDPCCLNTTVRATSTNVHCWYQSGCYRHKPHKCLEVRPQVRCSEKVTGCTCALMCISQL